MKYIFKSIILMFAAACILTVTLEAQADTGYFRELVDRKVTFLSDGVYGACLILGVEDRYNNFESQKNFLKEKGVLPGRLKNAGAKELLRKGAASYMFSKALDIKGGAVMRVFGPSEKYALRELIYKKLVSSGPERQIVSGKELLSILMRASEYKAKK